MAHQYPKYVNRIPVSRAQLIEQIRAMSIGRGDLLHVKVSSRSLGPVQGGIDALLDALIEVVGPEGTLVVDAFTYCFKLPMTSHDKEFISDKNSDTYTGYFNQKFIQHPLSVRSRHPVHRFAAIGALAHLLMDGHTAQSPAYDVLEQMAIRGGKNLNIGKNIIGVATTHVAIEETSLVKRNPPKGVYYRDEDGAVQLFRVNWNGGCIKGAIKFVEEYEKKGFVKRGIIGHADAMLTDMQGTLAVDRDMIARDPSSFFCDDLTCKDCRLRWNHSQGSWVGVKWHSFLVILKRAAKRFSLSMK
ncbi:MAG: AAC(3) family N-acetyltransferase [Marinilabiliaceae bacterium]|nr:AAC(3) family N-acetyltransferase [Marinilabiliaceae bacterium]